MESSFSPDGTIRIDWDVFHGRMGHEIYAPTVVRAATGEKLLAMGSDWDGAVRWLDGDAFEMGFRRYASGGALSVRVEPAKGTFEILGRGFGPEPLVRVHERLEEEIEKTARRSRPSMKEVATLAFIVLLLIASFLDRRGRRRGKHPAAAPPSAVPFVMPTMRPAAPGPPSQSPVDPGGHP